MSDWRLQWKVLWPHLDYWRGNWNAAPKTDVFPNAHNVLTRLIQKMLEKFCLLPMPFQCNWEKVNTICNFYLDTVTLSLIVCDLKCVSPKTSNLKNWLCRMIIIRMKSGKVFITYLIIGHTSSSLISFIKICNHIVAICYTTTWEKKKSKAYIYL